MLQSSEPEGPLKQADSGASAPGMHQCSADEESGDLHTGPSSRRVSVSSEPAFPDRGEHVQSDTSTSCSPCGCVSVAATTGYRWVWHSGVGATLASSTVMSFNAVAIKVLGQPGHNVVTFEIVSVRGGVCVLLSLLVGVAVGMKHLKSQRKNWPVLAVRGLSGSISMALYLVAIMNLPLADAITLFFCNPALTVLLAWAVLGEPLVPLALLGIACSLVGVVVVAQPPFLFGGHELWTPSRVLGVTCGISAAFTSATAYVTIRKISRTESALAIALWFHSASFIMGVSSLLATTFACMSVHLRVWALESVPAAVLCTHVSTLLLVQTTREGPAMQIGVPDAPTMPKLLDWALMLAVAVTSFGGQLVLGRAYQIEVASKVAAVNYVQVLFAFLFGILLFGDALSPLSICGSLLIAGGIITSSSSKPKPATGSGDKEAQELAHLQACPDPGTPPAAPKRGASSAGQGLSLFPLHPKGLADGQGSTSPSRPADDVGSDAEGSETDDPDLRGDSVPLLPGQPH